MKYMHFNSSCSYASLANLLALQGLETEDYMIALDMGLPYFLRYEKTTGAYINGPMLQSAEWFNLYLKPQGFCYKELFVKKEEVLQTLCPGSMLGLQVTPQSKHAVVFLGTKDGQYEFLNNKWENSEEPDRLLLSAKECLERLPELVVVGQLELCKAEAVDLKPYLEEALENWEKLRRELQQFVTAEQSSQALKESMNRLFRPLLLDGLSMAKLLKETELVALLEGLQKQFLCAVRKNEAVRLAEELDCGEIDRAIDEFVRLVENLVNLQSIRESERHSHIELYSSEELYKEGSWLSKPIKTVTDLFPLFEGYKGLHALDLGCGVGRNSIAIAKHFFGIPCRVDCVDILELAIEKLEENAKKFGVGACINGIVCPIEDYNIEDCSYDLIVAVSALEHIDSEKSFVRKLEEMQAGLKLQGVVCLVVNSEVKEQDKETKESLPPQFEVNLPTEELQELLQKTFSGWEVLKSTVREQKYDIPREGCMSELTTNVVTFVARKSSQCNL